MRVPVPVLMNTVFHNNNVRGVDVFDPTKLNNLALWLDPKYGVYKDGAAKFDGTNGSLTNASYTPSSEGTWAAWVRLDDPGYFPMVFSTVARELRFTISSRRPEFVWSSSSATWPDPVTLGQWNLLAGEWDSLGNIYFSLNGGAFVTASGGAGVDSTFTIGQRTGNTTYPFNGAVDSGGMWNRRLSQAELLELYNSGLGRSSSDLSVGLLSGLVDFYDFNETNGTRFAAIGTHNLTMNNNVVWSSGIVSGLASDNDPVSKWIARTGQVFAVASGNARPTYKTGGGKPYLQFDGVDDALSSLQLDLTGNSGITAAVNARLDIAGAYPMIFLPRSATYDSTFVEIRGNVTAGTPQFVIVSGNADSAISMVGTTLRLIATYDNANLALYVDNGAPATAFYAGTIAASGNSWIGNRDSSSIYPMNGRIGDIICTKSIISADDRAKLDAFLMDRMP